MKTKLFFCCIILFFVCTFGSVNLYSQNSAKGTLSGKVTGAEDKKALPFASVVIDGTNLGAATDIEGNYFIRNIVAGNYTISISYVGYETKKINVVIKPNGITQLNVALKITAVKGKEVVVTAQRTGQQGAINEQINSDVIKNVVAADRLQENPDANLAEAIGRLPGISLIRSGGEGTGLVIRGMNPKYTQVEINGMLVPSTSSDNSATDIAGISQYAVHSVEVFKTITPDMKADAVGGVVNLELGQAPTGLRYNFTALGGYNNLNNYWKNYQFAGNISDRFFDNSLGVKLNANVQNVIRSDQSLGAWYQTKTIAPLGQLAPLYVGGITLNDIGRLNHRASGTLVLDYSLSSKTKFVFSNFYSYANQNFTETTKEYDLNGGGVDYFVTDAPTNVTELYVGSIRAKQKFSSVELDEGIGFSLSHAYMPGSREWYFQFTSPALSRYGDILTQSLPLNQILSYATDNSAANINNLTSLYSLSLNSNDLLEKHTDFDINCKVPFNLTNYISAYIKIGAEYKIDSRNERPNYESQTVAYWINTGFAPAAVKALPWASVTSYNGLATSSFYGGILSNFIKGQFNFGFMPNLDRLNQLFDWWNNFSYNYLYVNPSGMPGAFGGYKLGLLPNWSSIKFNSQELTGYYKAGYIMGQLNLGDMLILTPGVRFEDVTDKLNGWWMEAGVSTPNPWIAPGHSIDSTHNDAYWFPMVNLKIKPTDWLQGLLSFTRTLHRPDYNMLASNIFVNITNQPYPIYQSGNPNLKPEIWTNYDAQVAAFGNKIGLISADVFYKEVNNFIWIPTEYSVGGQPRPFGTGEYFSPNTTIEIKVPQNHTFPVYIKGLEVEIQTNLWYLPTPFNFITLDANFTLMKSQTAYQNTYIHTVQTGTDSKGRPIYNLATVDSIYSGPVLNQPKSVVNLSFGYNYKGFNLWASYQYTGAMVTSKPSMKELETSKASLALWDLQVTQKLPVRGLSLLFDLANINNPIQSQKDFGDPRPTYLENYGWSMDFGIRYNL